MATAGKKSTWMGLVVDTAPACVFAKEAASRFFEDLGVFGIQLRRVRREVEVLDEGSAYVFGEREHQVGDQSMQS